VFFIRDGMKFPDMVHSLKPNPKNHIQEGWRIADFFSHHPEALNMVRLSSNSCVAYREMCMPWLGCVLCLARHRRLLQPPPRGTQHGAPLMNLLLVCVCYVLIVWLDSFAEACLLCGVASPTSSATT
jgi:hypothetical protein